MIGQRRAALTGRSAELAVLAGAAESARGGRGGLVLVFGEAGVGKSRLCREFAASLDGALQLRGQAYPGDSVVGNVILVDTLRSARREPESPLWPAARRRAALLSTLVPELLDEAGSTAAVDEAQIFETVLDAVEDAAGGRLVAWLAEDIQWADPASWRFLHYCARRAQSMPLLVLASFRDDESLPDDPAWTRLSLLGARDGQVRLQLARLSPRDTERIARELCGAGSADEVVLAIAERSGGTPLLVEELAAMRDTIGGRPGGGVPEVVRATARERGRMAGPAARDLLELAAVMGHDADLDLLVDLRPEQAQAIERLVAAGLLRRLADTTAETGIEFRHPLLREAVYQDIPWERRRRLHAEAAQALTVHTSMQSVERVARHWELAGRPDLALACLVEVIDQVRRQGNIHRSVALGRLALDLVDGHERLAAERARLVGPHIEDLVAAGRWADLLPMLRPAWEAAAPGSPLRARLTAYWALAEWFRQSPIEEQLRRIEAELAVLADHGTPEAARLYTFGGLMYFAAGDLERSREMSERGIAIAAACGDLDIEGRARVHLAWVRVKDLRERAAALEDLRAFAVRAGAAGMRTRQAGVLFQVARISCDLADVAQTEAVGHLWNPWVEMGARCLRAAIAVFAGRHDEARAILDDVAERVGGEGQAGWTVTGVRLTSALMRGDTEEARRLHDWLAARLSSSTAPESVDTAALLGWLLWEEGKLDHAAEVLGAAVEQTGGYRWEPGHTGPYFMPLLVDALVRSGGRSRAEATLGTVAARERHPDMDRYTAAGLATAELRLHPSPAALRQATAACHAAGWPWLGGLAQYWAAALLGDRGAARLARDIWRQVGYRPGVERAERLIAAGGRVLTAREETVAELIAEGLTNAQIAERLSISPVTVAHHVSSVLDKLEVSSRTQVAVLLTRGAAGR